MQTRPAGRRAPRGLPAESGAARARRALEIVRRLAVRYADVKIPLRHRNPLQLLVSTILSAQSTDAQVNRVTPALFKRYHSAADFAGARKAELEGLVHSTGFFHAKARAIQGMARRLLTQHGGEVPRTMEELVALPGVGRKTANVVLSGEKAALAHLPVLDLLILRPNALDAGLPVLAADDDLGVAIGGRTDSGDAGHVALDRSVFKDVRDFAHQCCASERAAAGWSGGITAHARNGRGNRGAED